MNQSPFGGKMMVCDIVSIIVSIYIYIYIYILFDAREMKPIPSQRKSPSKPERDEQKAVGIGPSSAHIQAHQLWDRSRGYIADDIFSLRRYLSLWVVCTVSVFFHLSVWIYTCIFVQPVFQNDVVISTSVDYVGEGHRGIQIKSNVDGAHKGYGGAIQSPCVARILHHGVLARSLGCDRN